MLDNTAEEIHNLSRKMHRLTKRIEAKNGVEPHRLGRGKRDRKRLKMMWKEIRNKLNEIGIPSSMALVNTLTVRFVDIDDDCSS